MIQIDSLTVGMFQSNCYIVSCTETGRGVIIDAGDEGDRIVETISTLGIEVDAVVNTHAHLDHVAALPEVVAALGVPVWMHQADMALYEGLQMQASMFGLTAPPTVAIDRFIESGETIAVGNLECEVLLAPGHSPGSVCLKFSGEEPPRVVCGDVLFLGSIGRTDLPGGSYPVMMETLRDVLLPMSNDTVIYPGHGPATTIGNEKRSNPFLAPMVRMQEEE
jgi:glyoxylase-like metal-dependent hydrolase (beta-lactamase superfamily II)